MVHYKRVRRAAYRPASGHDQLTARYQAFPFPGEIVPGLLELRNAGRAEQRRFQTPPTRRLTDLLQVLASDVSVMRPGDPSVADDRKWLYCPVSRPNPLPDAVMRRLFQFWVKDVCPEEASSEQLAELIAEVGRTPMSWGDVDVPLLGCPVNRAGTARPTDLQYLLTADYFARRIQDLPPYEHGSERLVFRAVARGPRQQGAELMSQPLRETKTDYWWFSVVINVTVQTVPFDAQPKIHLHVGIRRWATHPDSASGRLRLGHGYRTSVYMRPVAPWLPGAPVSERYGVARIGWDRRLRDYRWSHDGAVAMLRRIASSRDFPEVADLLSAPVPWLRGERDVQAGVVHGTRAGGHFVGAGLMPRQRSEIIAWAEHALTPELERVPDLTRSRFRAATPANVHSSPDAEQRAEPARFRRRSLARLCTHRSGRTEAVFEPRLLWQSPEVRDLAIRNLTAVLGLPGDGGAAGIDAAQFEAGRPGEPVVLSWSTDELEVRLRCLRLGPRLVDRLGDRPGVPTKRAEWAEAIDRRRSEVAKFLVADGANVTPTLAIVEIAPRKMFGASFDDPKFAVRLGASDAGVSTQFIATQSDTGGGGIGNGGDEQRAHAAWLDGLRQLGVSVLPIAAVPTGLPDDVQYLGIWMAATERDTPATPRRKLPVAVLVRPDSAGPEPVVGWDPEASGGVGAWVPYPRFLTRLPALARIRGDRLVAAENPPWLPWTEHNRNLGAQQRAAEALIQKVLYSAEVRNSPTILLAESQNSRRQWKWLQDGVVEPDLIRTGRAHAASLDTRLRLVRVRTAQQRETAQWWGLADEHGIKGLAAGLWETGTDSRVFYSTTAKPAPFKYAAVEADKLAPRPIRTGRRTGEPIIDVDRSAWNPGLVEIAVLGYHPDEGDAPDAIAMAVHQMRQAPDYLGALRLPLPLHLARLAQEYVLPVREPDEEVDEDAQTPESDVPEAGEPPED